MPLRTSAFRALLAAFLSVGIGGCTTGDGQSGVAIRNVSVIDARSPEPRANRTVVVQGNRIVAEGPADSVTVPEGARVIDGTGKFLTPGLWDMHVHLTMPGGRDVLPLYVLNGVTGVRDMASYWEPLQAMRSDIAGGTLVGPRIVSSGPYLEGGDVPIPHLLVKTPADAEPAIDSLIKLGVDFIKVHGQLTPESYYAIARAARARRIPFAGHVSRSIGAANASDSGQASIEHILAIPNPCTAAEVVELAPRFPVQAALGRCDTTDQAPLYATLQRNSTWVVPTLVAQVEVARWPKRDLPGDSLAGYLPDSLRDYVAGIFPMVDSVPPDADVNGLKLFARRVAVTGALFRAGVGVMAGTDAPLRNSPPGFGIHEELLHLTQAGLTPWEALKAATYEPARFLGAFDSLGTVEAGKVADLVLLSANPLADIRNSSRTEWVIANGRLHEVKRDRNGRLMASGDRK